MNAFLYVTYQICSLQPIGYQFLCMESRQMDKKKRKKDLFYFIWSPE